MIYCQSSYPGDERMDPRRKFARQKPAEVTDQILPPYFCTATVYYALIRGPRGLEPERYYAMF